MTRDGVKAAAVLVVGGAITNLAIICFVVAEHTLYVADQVAYWSLSVDLARLLARDPVTALRTVAASVASQPLNLLPALPLSLTMLLVGGSRLAYLLAINNLYAIPALVAMWMLVRRSAPGRSPWTAALAVGVAALAVPAFWYPLTLGYLGVGGIVLAALAWWLYLEAEDQPRSLLYYVAAGFTVALLLLFRRWWAFWSLSFCIVVAAEAVVRAFSVRRAGPSVIWHAVRGAVLVGASAAATLIVLALPRMLDVLSTDYGDRYAIYKVHHGVIAELTALGGHFGLLTLVVVVVAGGIAWRAGVAREIILLAAQLVLVYLLFRRVQDPTPQHYYLYIPGLMTVMAMGLVRLRRRWTIAGVMVIAAGVTGWAVFAPSPAAADGWLPVIHIEPEVREDLAEVERLLTFLDGRLEDAPGFVYVLASSETLSETTLAFVNLSLDTNFRSPSVILRASHVDERDGFPVNLLRARYVLLGVPVQCEQPPLHQRVIEIPATSLLEGRGIGAAFRQMNAKFGFERGVTVELFERHRWNTQDEVDALSEELRRYYPGRPEIYAPPPGG